MCPFLSLVQTEGYNTLRRKFGADSFFVNGPYNAIMNALTPTDFSFPGFGGMDNNGPMETTLPPTAAVAQALQAPPEQPRAQPQQQYQQAAPYYSQTISPLINGQCTNL